MAHFFPRQIIGKWESGFALDIHLISSEFLGYDGYGRPQFDSKRSEIGDLLYRLKYGSDTSAVEEIVEAAVTFLKSWNPTVDMLVPVPPSTPRKMQPVAILAKAIGKRFAIPVSNCVTKTRNTRGLKSILDLDERLKLLDGLHSVDISATKGKRILLFDDLYRSGATMNAITDLLNHDGQTATVFALAITRTRNQR